MRQPRRNGTTPLFFEPQQLLWRLAWLIPPPRQHLGRYQGVLAPASPATSLDPLPIPIDLCAYLLEVVPDAAERGVCIDFDARRLSRETAREAAEIVSGAGIRVFLFTDLVPTPVLAYSVIERKAAAGVMITASHNPPEYNGYKVYWGHGAQ